MTEGKAIAELQRTAEEAGGSIKQKYLLLWAIEVLDKEPDMSLDDYLTMVDTVWPKSKRYKEMQLDLAFKTLDELEDEIERRFGHGDNSEEEEVRSADEPSRQDDKTLGVDEHFRDHGI